MLCVWVVFVWERMMKWDGRIVKIEKKRGAEDKEKPVNIEATFSVVHG